MLEDVESAAIDVRKRTLPAEESSAASERAKMSRHADTCAYWLTKRNRYCLTRPVEGEAYCQVHLELTLGKQPANEHNKSAAYQRRRDSSGSSVVEERPAPVAGRCNFWLARKRRYCKLLIPPDGKYCVEHSVASENTDTRERIPCPKDPKHSCYKDQLDNHLKKCNARDDKQPECYEKSINAGEADADSNIGSKVSIREVEVDEVKSIIGLVSSLHEEFVQELETSVLLHAALQEEISKPENGTTAQKHLLQQASLIGHMDALGLLRDGVDYIEFGAGKGGLSHWIQIANASHSNNQYILVDRSSCRYKKDSYHKGADQGPSFQRLKIDIENLNLAKVPALQHTNRPLIGIGKHLCGSATDLMLRCLGETANCLVGDSNSRVEGIALALCCHHRCDWRSYVGKQWFHDRGLGVRQFQLIVSMSAWATCTSRNEIDKLSHRAELCDTDYCHPRYGSLDAAQREAVGIKCKQLLDTGRVHYLAGLGFNPTLLYYVQRSLTLENVALTATRRQQPSVDISKT